MSTGYGEGEGRVSAAHTECAALTVAKQQQHIRLQESIAERLLQFSAQTDDE